MINNNFWWFQNITRAYEAQYKSKRKPDRRKSSQSREEHQEHTQQLVPSTPLELRAQEHTNVHDGENPGKQGETHAVKQVGEFRGFLEAQLGSNGETKPAVAAAAATTSQDTDRMAVSSDVISPHSEQGNPDALVEEKASVSPTAETTSATPLMWTAMTLSLSQDTKKTETPQDQSHVILTRPLRSQLLRNKDFQTNIEELTGQRPSAAGEFQHVVSEVDAIQPAGSHEGIAAHKGQTEAPDADPTFPRVEPGILNIRVLPEKVPRGPEKERKGLSPPPEVYHDMVAADSIAPEIEPTKSPSERGSKAPDIRSEKAPVYPQKDPFKTKATKGIDVDHGAAKMGRAKTKITRKPFHFVIYKGMKRLKDDK
jgi:hypothetical protein